MNQHRALLHATSRRLKRLGILHQLESVEPFTADRNLRMDIVITRGGLPDALNREYRICPSRWTPPVQTGKRRYTCKGAVLITIDQLPLSLEAYKRQHYARPGHVSLDVEPSHTLATLALESFGRLGVEGNNFIDQLEACVVRGRDLSLIHI